MYLKPIHKFDRRWMTGKGVRGGLTIFTAILVLILMTLLMVYATRVSLFETRVSGNEMRQKESFHVAEAALDQSVMYLLQNASLVLSSQVDKFPDGTGFTRDGWFATGNTRWQPCPSPAAATHPCGGDVSATTGSFYYDTDGNAATLESLPVNTTDFPVGTTARISALLCFVNLSSPTGNCLSAPATPEEENDASLVLTLLAYGYSDCTDVTDVSTCTGEATIALPVSNWSKLAGSPAVPLVTKSTFPPTGVAEVVGNPNGGGIGVPLTSWINDNPDCPPATPIESSGTWQTCEMQEWYHVEEYPEGVTCTDNNCLCGPGGNDPDYFLSYSVAGTPHINIDIVVDQGFPCDLFDFYFNYPRAQYALVKSQATVISDCSGLDQYSSGMYWVTGDECRINANTVVGSPENPIILISATDTVLGGGAIIYGVLYIFDGESGSAGLTTLGGATVYGSVIVDGTMDMFQGTFQIVYAAGVLAEATGIAGLGSVNGGWRDFGLPDIGW